LYKAPNIHKTFPHYFTTRDSSGETFSFFTDLWHSPGNDRLSYQTTVCHAWPPALLLERRGEEQQLNGELSELKEQSELREEVTAKKMAECLATIE